jgi:purine-binding chemotaxis protein CheW
MKQGSIQWEEVRRRLQASENSLRASLSEGPERIKTTFRQRAVQLAKEHASSKPVSRGIPALIFRLSQERYAIALKDLSEVLPFQACTQVPGASPQFLGVINLRGELRPVIDLARVLSGSFSTDSGVVLVLRHQGALKVDAVEDLREIRPEELARPVQGHYIQALASGSLGLLDVETMLSAVFSPKESRSV